MQRGARQLQSACFNLSANQNAQDSSTKVMLERQRYEKGDIEDQLRMKVIICIVFDCLR